MISQTRTHHAGITKKLQLHYNIQGVIQGILFTMAVYSPICIVAVVVKLWT
jgi:hypothetical protein